MEIEKFIKKIEERNKKESKYKRFIDDINLNYTLCTTKLRLSLYNIYWEENMKKIYKVDRQTQTIEEIIQKNDNYCINVIDNWLENTYNKQ